MLPALKEALRKYYHTEAFDISSVVGGDINDAYLVQLPDRKQFIKVNSRSEAFDMFSCEQESLLEMSKVHGVRVPECDLPIKFKGGAFLPMQYIAPGRPTVNSWEALAVQIFTLHEHAHPSCGWARDNYIGSLQQPNKWLEDWPSFYTKYRLKPQFDLAFKQGYFDEDQRELIHSFLEKVRDILPHIKPTLLHGDFWSGNYHWDKNGAPFLIDPACYFGHAEVDLAMARLFGGFDQSFFEYYDSLSPALNGRNDRIRLYQLYYILVHLNLFGSSYYGQALQIIAYFSGKK